MSSRDIHPATLAALASSHFRLVVFARIDFDEGVLAFNSSFRDRVIDGVTYIGTGDLGSVSSITEGGELNPSDYSIELSGVNDTSLSAAATVDYLNKKAITHVATVDENGDVIGEPFIWFEGLTDSVNVDFGKVSRIVTNVRDRLSDWTRRRIARYTDAEQQRLFPGDLGLEYVNQVASRDVVWPAKTWFQKNA